MNLSPRNHKIKVCLYCLLIFVCGCASQPKRLMAALPLNYPNYDQIKVGMTVEEVEQLMGPKAIVSPHYDLTPNHVVPNPYRQEVFKAKNAGEETFVPILEYDYAVFTLESPETPNDLVTEPVFFKDGKVIGKGHLYYENDLIVEKTTFQDRKQKRAHSIYRY